MSPRKIALLILQIYYLVSLPLYCAQKPIFYTIEALTPDSLKVSVDRPDAHRATKLVLNYSPIKNQVENASCDGDVLQNDKPGIWSVPAGCKTIQWQVPLIENAGTLASEQQSGRSMDMIIFSEASSLPRLQDASGPEMIKLSMNSVTSSFPLPNRDSTFALPSRGSAPFFLLLNPPLVENYRSGNIRLRYVLDNPDAISRLPQPALHMKGLRWLSAMMPGQPGYEFTVAWLGSAKHASLGGAAGHQILLVNYSVDDSLPFDKAMLLYVGLHEAFHQFAMNYPPPACLDVGKSCQLLWNACLANGHSG